MLASMKLPAVGLASIALLSATSGCAKATVYPAPLAGSSTTVVVRGQYAPIALDRVDALSVEDGKLTVHGSAAKVTVDLPATVDVSQPTRHWALITEADTGRARAVTFTHEESLDDFTIELPPGNAPIHYGVFSGRTGDEVMVFAWGAESRSFWGYAAIGRRPSSAARH
jgi:hypothetical protein